jgi:hypothetical protein
MKFDTDYNCFDSRVIINYKNILYRAKDWKFIENLIDSKCRARLILYWRKVLEYNKISFLVNIRISFKIWYKVNCKDYWKIVIISNFF